MERKSFPPIAHEEYRSDFIITTWALFFLKLYLFPVQTEKPIDLKGLNYQQIKEKHYF